MGTSEVATTCATCGERLPAGSRFCPSCGAASTGAVAVFDLGDRPTAIGDEEHSADPENRDRTPATIAGLVLGVLVLLIGLSLVTGDGSGEAADELPEPTTSTTRPATTTTPPWRDDDDDDRLLASGSVLDPAHGMAAVWFRPDGTVITADLATGAHRVIEDDLPTNPRGGVRWTGDSFLVLSTQGGDLFQLGASESSEWIPVDTGDYEVNLWWPNHGPVVSVWQPASTDPGERPARVTPDGRLEVFEFSLAVGPTTYVDGRLAVSIDGATYLLDVDGTPARHAFGAVVGGADRYLVRRSCDEVLTCELVLDDVVAGTSDPLGSVELDAQILVARPAPDGSAVAVVAPARNTSSLVLRIVPTDGSAPLAYDIGYWNGDPDSLIWSPDGNGLLWRDDRGPSIRSIRWRGAETSTEPAQVDLVGPARSLHGGYEGLFLVPLDAVPSRWTPADPGDDSAASAG